MTLKDEIKDILRSILKVQFKIDVEPRIEVPPNPDFGDFSTNVSSYYPKPSVYSFEEFMKKTISSLRERGEFFDKIEQKGSYINIFLKDDYLFNKLRNVVSMGDRFGSSSKGNGKKILVEFVSANPTGPLNVVSARAAAVGDTLVNLLNFTGYKADAEYYINDAGRQVRLLGISAEKRFEELLGKAVEIPEDGYKGEYIIEWVKEFINDDKMLKMGEKERIQFFTDYIKDRIVDGQRETLVRFGVSFKMWISEKDMIEKFSIEQVVDYLRERGDIYEKEGAVWFATKKYGDDKDRVLIKGDGTHTYIVSDASYHKDKFDRGYDYLINLWGPDHHGDIMRLKAAVEAFGFNPGDLEIMIVQQVSLLSGGKKEKMSKRAGKFVTLDSLLDEVNKDAVRFFFLMRKTTAHLDFDIELAKTLSLENPVYYTQYCHARTVNIENFAKEKGVLQAEEQNLSLLTEPQEKEIAKMILLFPEVVENAAEKRDVHRIPYYLLDLSKTFHSYYQKTRIVTDDIPLSLARLFLVQVVQQIMRNGLRLIGVTAPERM